MTVPETNPQAWTPPRWLVIAASVVLVGIWIAARLSTDRELVPDSNERSTIAVSGGTTSEPPASTQQTVPVAVEPEETTQPPKSVPAAAAEPTSAEPVATKPPGKPVVPGSKDPKPAEPQSPVGQKPAEKNTTAETGPAPKRIVVQNITIKDQSGKTVYKGEIDLTPTFARIERGDRHEHRNDGSTFRNLEGRLPKKPAGYYKEYVHPTPGIGGPGPQRVVIGENGEAYYTHDHYRTFRKVRS